MQQVVIGASVIITGQLRVSARPPNCASSGIRASWPAAAQLSLTKGQRLVTTLALNLTPPVPDFGLPLFYVPLPSVRALCYQSPLSMLRAGSADGRFYKADRQ